MISLEKSDYQLVLNLCDLAMKLYQNEMNFVFFKKEEHIFKNGILLVNNECNMLKSTIRKDLGLVKTIRNKLYNTRKDTDAFKINSQNCKKKRVKVTAKKM